MCVVYSLCLLFALCMFTVFSTLPGHDVSVSFILFDLFAFVAKDSLAS
jgi:hypothetical protein